MKAVFKFSPALVKKDYIWISQGTSNFAKLHAVQIKSKKKLLKFKTTFKRKKRKLKLHVIYSLSKECLYP